jgi:capsular polysaccharide biosynthesis protein
MKALDERMFQEDVMAKKTSNVRVIQPAEVPVAPNNLRMMIIGAGAALSLFAGVAAAFLSEVLRRGYLTPETLEHRVRVPVLVSVPKLPSPPRPITAIASAGPTASSRDEFKGS